MSVVDDRRAAADGGAAEVEYVYLERAFEDVRQAIINELESTSYTKTDKVLELHKALQNLAAVKQAILNVIHNGQLARFALGQSGITREYR